MRLTVYINSIVAIHGLCGREDRSWTDVRWHDRLPSFPSGSRLSLYSYDVFGSNGGVLTRSGASDEATKLLDSLLELRRRDSKVRDLDRSGLGCDKATEMLTSSCGCFQRIAIAFVGHDIGGSLIKAVGYRYPEGQADRPAPQLTSSGRWASCHSKRSTKTFTCRLTSWSVYSGSLSIMQAETSAYKPARSSSAVLTTGLS